MKRLTLALAIAAMALGGGAQAIVLPAGNTPLSGTTLAANPQLAGTVLEDDVVPFSFGAYGGTVTGSVQSRVVRSSVDGTLDFYWRVLSDAGSSGPITYFRLADFVTPVYDGDYRTDSLGTVAPDRVVRSGADLTFVFWETPIRPGESSHFMFLDTRAFNYQHTALYDLATPEVDSSSEQFATFVPVATSVPEPGTYALMAGGLGMLALTRRRRGPAA